MRRDPKRVRRPQDVDDIVNAGVCGSGAIRVRVSNVGHVALPTLTSWEFGRACLFLVRIVLVRIEAVDERTHFDEALRSIVKIEP